MQGGSELQRIAPPAKPHLSGDFSWVADQSISAYSVYSECAGQTMAQVTIETTNAADGGRSYALWIGLGFATFAVGASVVFTPLSRHVDTGFLWSVGCALPSVLALVL